MYVRMTSVLAAFICGLVTVLTLASAQANTETEKYIKCAIAANKRADAKHCDAYKEAISCGNKAIAAAQREASHYTSARSTEQFQKAIGNVKAGNESVRKAARKNGCNVD